MKIEYTASVHTRAGWRSVTIAADAERISDGMARVMAVTTIDGEDPRPGMSRTGARRQQFNGASIAAREVNARKRLSACAILEE